MHGISVTGTVIPTGDAAIPAPTCSAVAPASHEQPNHVAKKRAIITRGDNYVDYLVKRIQASAIWKNPQKKVAIVMMFDEGNATNSTDPYNSCCGWSVRRWPTSKTPHRAGDGQRLDQAPSGRVHFVRQQPSPPAKRSTAPNVFDILSNQTAAPEHIQDSDAFSRFPFVRTLQDINDLPIRRATSSPAFRATSTPKKFVAREHLSLPGRARRRYHLRLGAGRAGQPGAWSFPRPPWPGRQPARRDAHHVERARQEPADVWATSSRRRSRHQRQEGRSADLVNSTPWSWAAFAMRSCFRLSLFYGGTRYSPMPSTSRHRRAGRLRCRGRPSTPQCERGRGLVDAAAARSADCQRGHAPAADAPLPDIASAVRRDQDRFRLLLSLGAQRSEDRSSSTRLLGLGDDVVRDVPRSRPPALRTNNLAVQLGDPQGNQAGTRASLAWATTPPRLLDQTA